MVKRLALVTVTVLVVGWLLTPPRSPTSRGHSYVLSTTVIEPVEPIPIQHKDVITIAKQHAVSSMGAVGVLTRAGSEEDLPMLDHVMSP
jgi:pSer/pThr/pTyr-binding forkhead associated (FHA) protein